MLIMIDNYDSFTYNLVQYLAELGAMVRVFRNDATDIATIEALNPTHLVISPGPCSPNEAGISMEVIAHFAGKVPILGVCLGHQAIAQVFGGRVVRAHQVMHGKTSAIEHGGTGVFHGLKNPLIATRYHSLIVESDTLPEVLEAVAWATSEDGTCREIMALQHKTWAVAGVQFHPESILTEQGKQLLANFLAQGN